LAQRARAGLDEGDKLGGKRSFVERSIFSSKSSAIAAFGRLLETIARCAAVGGPFHDSPAEEPTTTLARMPSGISAAVDRRLEDVIVAWTRRQYPARWIRPAVAPAAVRLRRVLWRGVLAAATPIGMILVLVIVKL
jgi:hypothetical protein